MNQKRFLRNLLLLAATAGCSGFRRLRVHGFEPIWMRTPISAHPGDQVHRAGQTRRRRGNGNSPPGQGFFAGCGEKPGVFRNLEATIKTCSDTQIVVYRPNITGDSLTIK